MSDSIDTKAHILGKLYSDQEYAQSTMKEVEEIRAEANKMAMATTVAIFGLNELARLTLRTRKFNSKLYPFFSRLQVEILERCLFRFGSLFPC